MCIKVLIVDDESDLSMIIQDYLEDEGGYNINVAHCGEQGLLLNDEQQPDICIVDMRLAEMTGNEFIIAAHQKRPDCKFIIHTGSLEYVLPDELKNIGINNNSILFKPVMDLAMITQKIEQVLCR